MKDLKYDLLKKYLLLSNKDYLVLTYKEINDIIQSELPRSAYKYRSFWGKGDTHVWVNAINNAGYEIASFSIESQTVSFKKDFNKPTNNYSKEIGKLTVEKKMEKDNYILYKSKMNDLINKQINLSIFEKTFENDNCCRYQSFEHFHNFFINNYDTESEDVKNIMALHLFAYLVSWGNA